MNFDNVKENIQPLATGRNASILQAALNVDLQTELIKQRETLENEISKYNGDDPLEPWFNYVSWIEQSYPSGGSEGGLKKVLHQCLESLGELQQYFQDRRMIRIYIKFIDLEDNPHEKYQELFNAGIGTMVADFYICWAYYYDLCGNFKMADMIFRKGKEVRAQPYNQLIQAYTNFGFTMSQRMLYQDEKSKVEFLMSLKNRRIALTSLKGANVGIIRCGNEIENPTNLINCNSSTNETVFQDNVHIIELADVEPSKSIVRNIIKCTRNQENNREPGPWSKGFSQKKGNLYKGSNRSSDLLGFTILEDDLPIVDHSPQRSSLQSQLHYQQNNFICGIQLPLKFVTKNCPQETWTLQTVLNNEVTQNAVPFYRKNYHYPKHNQEFCLEEFLAYKWFNKRNIKNKFVDDCSIFWGNEYSVGIRIYPNFASLSLPNKDILKLNQENLSLVANLGLAVNLNKIYPDDKTEMQFEEILCKKWQNYNQKLKVDTDFTNITENSVQETLYSNVFKDSISKLNVKTTSESPLKYIDIGKTLKGSNNSIKNNKLSPDDNFLINESDLYSTSINKNVSFNLNYPENGDLTDSDLLVSNESCSTMQFNLFLKTQSVSTPLSIRNPVTVINNADGKYVQSCTARPENQLNFPKQLSTIMETSETNAAVRKSSVDINLSNSDEEPQFLSYYSNVPLIKIEKQDEFSDRNQQLFIELNSDKKSDISLLQRRLFEEETNDTIHTLVKDETCTKNVFQKDNSRINLTLNPINFFEEKTENFPAEILNRQTSVAVHDTEIFEFLAKTPEKKYTTILKMNNYQSEDCTAINYSTEFSNLIDLSFPTLSIPQNICHSSKITEQLQKSEKKTPFSFPKDKEIKLQSEQIKTDMSKLISPHENYKLRHKIINNCSILTQNKLNGYFVPDVYLAIERNKTSHNILKQKYLYVREKKNYEIYNLKTFKNLSNILNINDKSYEKKLYLYKYFHFEYKIAAILERSKLFHLHIGGIKNLFNKLCGNKQDIPIPILSKTKNLLNANFSQSNIQQNKACIKHEKYDYAEHMVLSVSISDIDPISDISKYEQNLLLNGFFEKPFHKRQNNSEYIKYFGRGINSMNTSETLKIENHEDYEDPNDTIKEIIYEEINLDSSNDYISEHVIKEDINPFSSDLIEDLLRKSDFYSYIAQLESCELTEKMPRLRKGSKLNIKNLDIEVINIIGEGSYGTVFRGRDLCTGKQFAMKHEKPGNLWEYFICLELHDRLLNVDILCGLMNIQYALIASNASVFLTEFSPYGSLIAVCNKVRRITSKNIDEYVVMVLISQILTIIDHLHASEIIHADIKPDNFLVMRKLIYGSKTPSIQLIDFGVSIDLKQFARGQTFSYVHKKPENMCVEMRENRPWTFQIDLYGVATIIHVLLFGKYMEIHKVRRGAWIPKQHMPRYLNKTIWDKIFTELLNIPDCHSMPNLQNLRVLLEQEIVEKEKYVKDKVSEFNKAIDAL